MGVFFLTTWLPRASSIGLVTTTLLDLLPQQLRALLRRALQSLGWSLLFLVLLVLWPMCHVQVVGLSTGPTLRSCQPRSPSFHCDDLWCDLFVWLAPPLQRPNGGWRHREPRFY